MKRIGYLLIFYILLIVSCNREQKKGTALREWMGYMEQVDDITIIGVRV
jgi:cbb3-type cytochrome oxidase subunit 3